MKFTIETKSFGTALAAAAPYAQRASLFTLNSMVYLKTVDNTLTLRAGSLNSNFECTLSVADAEDGMVLVAAEKLCGVINKITSDNVTLERDDNTLYVKPTEGRKTSVKLACRDADEYPAANECADDLYVSVPDTALYNALSNVIVAVGRDSGKPMLMGIRFEQEEIDGMHILNLIATEGRVLAKDSVILDTPIPNFSGATVPTVCATRLMPVLKGGNTKIAFYNGKIFIKNGLVKLDNDLLNAPYPNWRRVIPVPEEATINVKLKGADLVESFGLTSVLVDANSRISALSFKKNTLTIAASAHEFGEAEQEIEVESEYAGEEEDLTLYFNEKLIQPIIASLRDRDVVFKLYGPSRNIRVEDENYSSLLYCLAPINKS